MALAWQAGSAQCVWKIGRSACVRLGASGDGRQVSRSLLRSRFLPAPAVTATRTVVCFTPLSVVVRGTASPGAVQPGCEGSSNAMALDSDRAVELRAGRTEGGFVIPPGVQAASPATLRQTERPNVHTPSTVPSLSHDGLPSKQLSSVVWSPPNSTRQSAAGFRPPPRQSGGQV